MALQTTTWWDKAGNANTGYIKDGKTFVDENATTRVPVGATVQTNGGTFKMTDNGGVPTAATARNQFESKTNAAINAYKAAGQIQNERINSATNAAIAELNRQKGLAKQNRVDADKAAKAAYEKAANPFGALEEQRVRLGLDESGYAESSKLRLASAYAAQLNENQRAMNEQLQNLDVQIAEARASGQYELANMLEARAQNIMQQKVSLQGNLYSGDMQAINQAENTRQFNEQMAYNRAQAEYNKEQAQKQWDYSVANDEYNKKLAKAEVLAQFGNFDGFRDIDYTDEQVNMMKSAYAAQRAQEAAIAMAKASGSGSTKSGGLTASQLAKLEEKKTNTQYLTNVLSEWKKSGLDMDTFIDTLGGVYGLTSDDKKELRAMAMSERNAPAPAGEGMSYGQVVEEITRLQKDKNKYRDPNQAVERAIDIVDGAGLAPDQIAAIKAMFADFFGI